MLPLLTELGRVLGKDIRSGEQDTHHACILHARQILPPETAPALIFVTCPDPCHVDELGCCSLLLWSKAVMGSSGSRH